MNQQPQKSTPGVQLPTSANPSRSAPSKSLRVWLILMTIGSVLVLLLTAAAAILGSVVPFFGFDRSDFTWSQFFTMQGLVWGLAVGMAVFLLVGVVGGWLAFRARRNGVSLALSLLALLPLALCLVGIVTVILTSSSPLPIDITNHP